MLSDFCHLLKKGDFYAVYNTIYNFRENVIMGNHLVTWIKVQSTWEVDKSRYGEWIKE
jgi:hypothetical protein